MKLTLERRLGAVQVRGGALLKVAKEHAVSSVGRPVHAHDHPQALPEPDGKWAFAKIGDLAVEVIAVKTGKTLGHSYLSGPAIQCNRYTPAQADWFEPATGKIVELPNKPTAKELETACQHLPVSSSKELIQKMMGEYVESVALRALETLIAGTYADVDVCAFEVFVEDEDEAADALQFFSTAGDYQPAKDSGPATSHLMGLISAGKHGKKGSAMLHFQPPHHASERCVTPFQIGLVLSALRGSR